MISDPRQEYTYTSMPSTAAGGHPTKSRIQRCNTPGTSLTVRSPNSTISPMQYGSRTDHTGAYPALHGPSRGSKYIRAGSTRLCCHHKQVTHSVQQRTHLSKAGPEVVRLLTGLLRRRRPELFCKRRRTCDLRAMKHQETEWVTKQINETKTSRGSHDGDNTIIWLGGRSTCANDLLSQ